MQIMLQEAMCKGGPRLATEKFLRTVVGDTAFESERGTALQERMLGNGDVLLSIEMKEFAAKACGREGSSPCWCGKRDFVPARDCMAGRNFEGACSPTWNSGPGVSGGAQRLL